MGDGVETYAEPLGPGGRGCSRKAGSCSQPTLACFTDVLEGGGEEAEEASGYLNLKINYISNSCTVFPPSSFPTPMLEHTGVFPLSRDFGLN